jgi:Na+-driven multidrug efflux pump
MKKRHEQKLVVLSLILFLLLNVPFILIFNISGQVFGIPTFYFSLFSIWLLSVIISFIVLRRHYE